MRYIATCKIGLESVVANELRKLEIPIESVSDARVIFTGDYLAMARACLWLRTAERVLMIAGEFHAETFEALFDGTSKIRWADYLRRDSFIHVTGKSAKSKLFSVSDCQSIVKKAIVDSLFRDYHTKSLPESGKRIIIEVGILRDEVTLALDCCGAGLSRRGYRTYNVAAPIAETLGAAIVLLSGYNPSRPLVDPMCGSGTMPIEAAMIASNIAVGANRSFAAEDWHFIPKNTFASARDEARSAVRRPEYSILGCDIDRRSIELCKKHAKKAGVVVDWKVSPFKDFYETRRGGIIVCNPPYGNRLMERRDAEKLYRQMHDSFIKLDGWSVNIITSHPEFERIYGARADKRRKLSNGGMTCTLFLYFPA